MNEGMQNQSVGRETKCDRLRVPQSIMTASQCKLKDQKLNVVGELPDKLQGHVFIVAPVGSVDSGGLPYPDGSPIFNGDGMIYRLDFDRKGEVRITNRIAKTPCYYADKATKPGSKYAKYNFKNHGLSRLSIALGVRNQLNTAFLKMRFSEDAIDRLLVTFDAGRPYEIDTESLEVVTPVGSNVEWRPEISRGFPFAPVLSTAHPVFDTFTDEMFTVNYGRSFGNFLETIPLIYEAEKLPVAIKKVLESIARFLTPLKLVKFLLAKISQFFGCIFQFFLKLIEKIAKINLQNFVYLIRWDGVGDFERWKLVLSDRSPVIINQSLHQIGLTRNYVILMDTAFSVGLAQTFNSPIPKYKHIEQAVRDILSRPVSPDTVLYIVRREDMKAGQHPASCDREVEVVARRVVIPLEAFHYAVDYEDSDGKITLHIGHICAADASEWMRQFDTLAYGKDTPLPSRLYGMLAGETDISRLGRYVIDAESGEILESKVILDDKCTWGLALYTYQDILSSGKPPEKIENIYWNSDGLWAELTSKFVFDLYKKYKYRMVPNAEILQISEECGGKPACLLRLDTREMAIADYFLFLPDDKSDGYMINSPQFIPSSESNDSSTDGYILCTVFYQNSCEIWIFDAQNLAAGPKCKLSHPSLTFGFTLHTAWLAKIGSRTAPYNIPVDQDYKEIVKQQSPEIQQLFEEEIYPRFK